MKIRVKFTRERRVAFIGHLDIMRAFQRGFIRAGVKMIYSAGYSPHQKMNFARPLGVAVTSKGDYLDAEIEDGQDLSLIRKNLDFQMGEGFGVVSVRELEEGAEKAMAAVRYASYRVSVIEGGVPDAALFTESEHVSAVRRTKSGEKETDIRPWVYSLKRDGNVFRFTVSAGSDSNLRPDLLMETLYRLSSLAYDRGNIRIEREELMAEGFVPLEDYRTVKG